MTRKRKIIRKKSNRPLLSINIGFLGLLISFVDRLRIQLIYYADSIFSDFYN